MRAGGGREGDEDVAALAGISGVDGLRECVGGSDVAVVCLWREQGRAAEGRESVGGRCRCGEKVHGGRVLGAGRCLDGLARCGWRRWWSECQKGKCN